MSNADDVAVAAAQNLIEEIILDDGRKLRLRQPSGQNYSKCLELAAGNGNLVQFFESLFCVVAIDGEQISAPISRSKADALAQRIGRRGIDLLGAWFQRKVFPEVAEIMDNLPPGMDGNDPEIQQMLQEQRIERLKKSRILQ